MEGLPILIFQLAVLLFSVMIHEISHGVVALKLGDSTARDAGRLTLNPGRHLDLYGSFLVPLFLLIVGSPFLVGWAKPVPYNPLKLKNPKKGAGLIAFAGPLSNIFVALVFGVLIRVLAPFADIAAPLQILVILFNIIVFINILLAVFNLVPLPPLDGSNILFAILPDSYYRFQTFLRQYGFFLLLFFIFFGFQLILPIILTLYKLIVGGTAIF